MSKKIPRSPHPKADKAIPSGMAAMGHPIPLPRKQAAFDTLREMNMLASADEIVDLIDRMSEQLERDRPYQAQYIAMESKLIDYTGALRLYATLLAADPEPEQEEHHPFIEGVLDILRDIEDDLEGLQEEGYDFESQRWFEKPYEQVYHHLKRVYDPLTALRNRMKEAAAETTPEREHPMAQLARQLGQWFHYLAIAGYDEEQGVWRDPEDKATYEAIQTVLRMLQRESGDAKAEITRAFNEGEHRPEDLTEDEEQRLDSLTRVRATRELEGTQEHTQTLYDQSVGVRARFIRAEKLLTEGDHAGARQALAEAEELISNVHHESRQLEGSLALLFSALDHPTP